MFQTGFVYCLRRFEIINALAPFRLKIALYDSCGKTLCCGLPLQQRRSDKYERSNISLKRGLISWSICGQREFLEVLIIRLKMHTNLISQAQICQILWSFQIYPFCCQEQCPSLKNSVVVLPAGWLLRGCCLQNRSRGGVSPHLLFHKGSRLQRDSCSQQPQIIFVKGRQAHQLPTSVERRTQWEQVIVSCARREEFRTSMEAVVAGSRLLRGPPMQFSKIRDVGVQQRYKCDTCKNIYQPLKRDRHRGSGRRFKIIQYSQVGIQQIINCLSCFK